MAETATPIDHDQQPTTPPTPAEVIGELLETGGPESLKDCVIEVQNIAPKYELSTPGNAPSSIFYRIRDAEVVQKQGVRTVRSVLPPSIQGPEDAIPFIYTRGGVFNFGRRTHEEPADVGVPVYTVEKINAARELEDVMTFSPEDLESLAAVATDVYPIEAEPDTTGDNPQELRLHLGPAKADAFDIISSQLDAKGIDDWGGMTWKETSEDPDTGQPVVRTLKIARENLVTHRVGKHVNALRAFTVEEYNEDVLTSKYILKDEAIRGYFKKSREQISDMHIPVPEGQADVVPDEERQRAADLEAAAARDKKGTMAFLLSYADVMNPEDKDAEEKGKAKLAEIRESTDGKRLMNRLEAMVDQHGVAEVYLLAVKLRNGFLAAARELRLPTEFADSTKFADTSAKTKKIEGASISWAIESLVNRYYYGRHLREKSEEYQGATLGDPFVRVARTNGTEYARTARIIRLEREIVDQQVGLALLGQTIDKKKAPKVVDVKDGQLVHDIEQTLEFQPASLEDVAKLTRDQVKAAEQEIYHDIETGKTVRLADLADLGRLMRRAIGHIGQ